MGKIAIRAGGLAMAVALAAGLAAAAGAETAADRAACTPSVLTLCPREALTLNREAALQCLVAHLAHASPQCQAVVRSHRAPPPARPAQAIGAR